MHYLEISHPRRFCSTGLEVDQDHMLGKENSEKSEKGRQKQDTRKQKPYQPKPETKYRTPAKR